ncbi:MAG: peptidylprolyl isomerase [Prevotellaceae bacterium]|nr:peptidylprolyl isomerase [Prevotellaceae bacterium]
MKTTPIFTTVLAASLFVACGNNPAPKTAAQQIPAEQTATQQTTAMEPKLSFDPSVLGEEPVLDIETSEGVITIKLYKDTPLHRDNFVKLASEGFFNGLIFHRVINGFMIQVGDPQSRNPQPDVKYGSGGPGYTIPAEILPKYKHKKGALAAARRGDAANPEKASSGSQFYIVHGAASHLDGAYSIFGETIKGFDIIDKIATTPTNVAIERPVKDIFIVNIQPAKCATK